MNLDWFWVFLIWSATFFSSNFNFLIINHLFNFLHKNTFFESPRDSNRPKKARLRHTAWLYHKLQMSCDSLIPPKRNILHSAHSIFRPCYAWQSEPMYILFFPILETIFRMKYEIVVVFLWGKSWKEYKFKIWLCSTNKINQIGKSGNCWTTNESEKFLKLHKGKAKTLYSLSDSYLFFLFSSAVQLIAKQDINVLKMFLNCSQKYLKIMNKNMI